MRTGQSGIDAALVLSHAGHHVTMTSRGSILPAVRTRTPLPTGALDSLNTIKDIAPDDELTDQRLTRAVVQAICFVVLAAEFAQGRAYGADERGRLAVMVCTGAGNDQIVRLVRAVAHLGVVAELFPHWCAR
ncbi:hypothetical protein ACQUSR_27645 [Streptomyces sp. P1-3]|uniref:hypothetical protein n=1 Tax=Streptomyces sp. P1-3 TaxID=3421658 RepID=UPI003D3657E2